MIDINQIKINDIVSVKKIINYDEIKKFSEISLDFNPIHLDKNYAQNSRYKKQIAHGMIPVIMFSGLFGSKLPGKGCVYKSQTINFKRPIYINDEVLIVAKVKSIDIKKKEITFYTYCQVNNKIVIDGEAKIFLPFK